LDRIRIQQKCDCYSNENVDYPSDVLFRGFLTEKACVSAHAFESRALLLGVLHIDELPAQKQYRKKLGVPVWFPKKEWW
jgi:hypothetical protein